MFESPLQQGKNSVSLTQLQFQQFSSTWFVDSEYRRLSQQTLAFRRILVEKVAWFIQNRAIAQFGTMEIRQFLMYLSTGHLDAEGRWGNNALTREVRPTTLRTYYSNLKVMFRWMVSEEYLEAAYSYHVSNNRSGFSNRSISSTRILSYNRAAVTNQSLWG